MEKGTGSGASEAKRRGLSPFPPERARLDPRRENGSLFPHIPCLEVVPELTTCPPSETHRAPA